METETNNTPLTVLDRIRYLMDIEHMTQARFARRIGMDPSNLSKYLSGKIPVNHSLINRVVVDFSVSKEWLTNGVGLPYDKPGLAEKLEEAVSSGAISGVPVYDIDVTAGAVPLSRMFTDDRIIGRISLPRLNPECMIVRVSGDSMDPVIRDGSYIAIRPIENRRNIFWGQIYVVVMEDYRPVKYVRRHEDGTKLILHSANRAYDDMEVDRDDVLGLYIVEAILNYDLRC